MTDATDTSALEMSDEEFAKLDFDSLPEDTAPPEDEVEDDDDTKDETVVSDEATDTSTEETTDGDTQTREEEEKETKTKTDSSDEVDNEDEGKETASEDAEGEKESNSNTSASSETSDDKDLDKAKGTKKEEGKKEEKSDTKNTDDKKEESVSETNYQQELERLLSPFKANGRDIQVKNVDEAITLMQMGANYNKKMAGMKPGLKILKMLDNNGLLDEDKLSYLIDLDKKDPAAIEKLLKDSGLDPLDIDVKKETKYKPNTYTVDDQSVELDQVLNDIRDTKSFNETLDIVGKKWDDSSRQVIKNSPNILKIINEHVESGAYQQIKQAVDNERMFGGLDGLSDLEAYKQVGDAINAKGGFNKATESTESTSTLESVKAKTKTVDPKLKSRKKAASSTNKNTSTAKEQFDPLSMSDEDFEKMAANHKF